MCFLGLLLPLKNKIENPCCKRMKLKTIVVITYYAPQKMNCRHQYPIHANYGLPQLNFILTCNVLFGFYFIKEIDRQ